MTRPRPAAAADLWSLDPDVTMLNHGSFGACPRAVLAEQRRLQDRLESGPVRFVIRELAGLWDGAIEALGRFLGAPAEDLAFVPNATTGVNCVLRSLAFSAGDEILLLDHAYNAVSNAATFVADRCGARVTRVTLPVPISSPEEVTARVEAAVTQRTKLAVIDHITSPTGLVLPVEEIVARLKARGIDTLVDGAHAPGHIPLDLTATGAAYYVGNCHKWLCTPKGSAFLYVAPERQAAIRPLTISHGANRHMPGTSRFRLEFDWTGTIDPTPFLCVPFAIDYLAAQVPGGWPEIQRRNRALAIRGRELLLEATGGQALAPESMVGCLASVTIPDAKQAAVEGKVVAIDPLQERLWSAYGIEVPVMFWPAPPKRLLRIAVQLYTSEAQIHHLADVLREIL